MIQASKRVLMRGWDENLWKRTVKRQKSENIPPCFSSTKTTIEKRIEAEDRGRGGGKGNAAEAWNDFAGNNNRGRERWTHNGRRSRTIIDRGVHAAGQPTDWLTYLYYGITEATLYPGHAQNFKRRPGQGQGRPCSWPAPPNLTL